MSSGGAMGGAQGARPPPSPSSPFLHQTEARRVKKIFVVPAPPPPEFREDYGINSS